MDDARKAQPEPLYSPAIGCVIIGIAIFVLGGCAIFFIYQGTRMNREIDKFTVGRPVPRTLPRPGDGEREALLGRIDAFAKAALAGEEAELSLDADDLNNLIATDDLLRDFRGNTRVVEINEEFIVAEMSQRMNSLMPGKPRYLNATFIFSPRRLKETLALQLVDITSPDLEIPRGFIDLYAQKQFFQVDPEHEVLGPVVKKIQQIGIRDARITASTAPPGEP